MKARAPIRTIVAPPLPRHSRESWNPQTNNVILAKAGTISPREIKYKQQPAAPFSLYGLAGAGWLFLILAKVGAPSGRGIGEPSSPS